MSTGKVIFGITLWAVAVGGVWYGMQRYALTSEPVAAAPVRWPLGSALAPDPQRPTLVMLLHPRCPCSRASVGELAELLAVYRDRMAVHIIFIEPTTVPDNWMKTDLWDAANRISEAKVTIDVGAREMKEFAACVSGETLLFAPTGELLFRGGLTPGRGHFGDGEGRAAIAELLTSPPITPIECGVFGCRLM